MTRTTLEAQRRMTFIEKNANIIREGLNMQIPFSKNIDEIIGKIGGKIEEGKNERNEISELIWNTQTCESEEIFIIRIKPQATKEVRNFGIACELGHLFFHTNYCEYCQNILENKTPLNRYEEWYFFDGIQFAMNLIMPRMEFSYMVEECTQNNKINITKLAQYFETTANSVVIRGEELQEFYYIT